MTEPQTNHSSACTLRLLLDAFLRERRLGISNAITDLTRAQDAPRLGYNRDQSLALAAEALRRAGLPDYAARAETEREDIGGLIEELAEIGRAE